MSNGPAFNPLDYPCSHCRVGPGQRCKNYRGKGKAPCPDRGQQRPAAPPEGVRQRALFDVEDDHEG